VPAHALRKRERETQLGGRGHGGPPPRFDAYFRQAPYAVRNVGEFKSIWLSDCGRPLLLGFGKFVTPFDRMQLAYLTASAAAVCPAQLGLVVVVEPRLATPFEDDPPQAASNTATPTSTTTRGPAARLWVPTTGFRAVAVGV
jgi:hypothetical protein